MMYNSSKTPFRNDVFCIPYGIYPMRALGQLYALERLAGTRRRALTSSISKGGGTREPINSRFSRAGEQN